MSGWLLIKARDNTAPEGPGKWQKLQLVDVRDAPPQGGEDPANGNFYVFEVTDRTPEELVQYVEAWDTKVIFEDLGGPPTQWRARVTNERVSSSGKNAFTSQSVEAYKQYFLQSYPDSDADISGQGTFTFQISAQLNGRDKQEYRDITEDFWASVQFERARWRVTAAGEAALIAADGWLVGTFAEIEPFLEDQLTK